MNIIEQKLVFSLYADELTIVGFDGSEYQSEVVFPESVNYENKEYAVTSVGDNAFFGCSSLTSITIPSSVTSIGFSAFNGCNNLTIYAEAASMPGGWDSNWNSSNRSVVWGYKG